MIGEEYFFTLLKNIWRCFVGDICDEDLDGDSVINSDGQLSLRFKL